MLLLCLDYRYASVERFPVQSGAPIQRADQQVQIEPGTVQPVCGVFWRDSAFTIAQYVL